MRALLDANFLIALLDLKHEFNARAQQWLAAHMRYGWCTCPLTENGYLRIVTGAKYTSPVSIVEALDWLDDAKLNPFFEFWPDELSVTAPWFRRSNVRMSQQVTDAYLLGLAVSHGARLVTFDTGISLDAVAGATEDNLFVFPVAR